MRIHILSTLFILLSLTITAQVNYTDYPGEAGPDGLVRCASMEVLEVQKQKGLAGQTKEFEKWLNSAIKKQSNSSRSSTDTMFIPVVVHVFHNGEAIGTAPNITDNQILSQIQVMNEDYLKISGTNGDNNDPVGASSMIKFVMAKTGPDGAATNGINRVNIGQDGATRDDIEGGLKQNSQWNPSQYMNMWSLKFAAPDDNLLGYAQFPEASGLEGMPTGEETAETDGVVMRFSAFGTSALDDGSFILTAPYDLGRTVTHEVGHFLGLRHMWGDGIGCNNGTAPPNCSCNEDDFCTDTPNSDQANFGCATSKTSACDPLNPTQDMVENYMDYSDDACMNIFTIDQVARMTAVMTNSPRRMELPFSPGLSPPTPRVSFGPAATLINEGTSCSTKELIVNVNIGLAPSATTMVTFSSLGTATPGVWNDFTISPDTVVFAAGDNAPKQLTITVYEDAVVESNENITIAIDSVITTGDAIKSFFDNEITTKIRNDDFDPLHAAFFPNSVLLSESFDAGFPANWTNNSILPSHDWVVGTAVNGLDAGTDAYAYISRTDLPGDLYSYNLTSPALSFLELPSMDMTYWKNTYLNFTYMVVGEQDATEGTLFDFGSLLYSIDGGSSWKLFGPDLVTAPSAQTVSIDLPDEVFHEPDVRIAFRWMNDELVGTDPPLAIDDVLVAGTQGREESVTTSVTNTPSEIYIGPNHDVYVYNGFGNNLIARFNNLSTYDYGCTTIAIDRTGTTEISGTSIGDQAALSILMTPTNNTNTGNYEVTTYYKDINITPWSTPNNFGCEDESALRSIRTDGPVNNGVNYSDFEKDRNSQLSSSLLDGVSEITGTYSAPLGGFGMADFIFSNTLYVNENAQGEEAGSYWNDAYTDLQSALDKVDACNSLSEIRIAKGTYHPTKDAMGNNNPADNTELTFKINNELSIIGGFAGSEILAENEDIDLRNLTMNLSTLSGDLNGDDAANFINYEDNSALILQQANGLTNLIIDGLTIASGNGEQSVLITEPATIRNVILEMSKITSSGSALLIDGANNVILENIKIKNTLGHSGRITNGAIVSVRGINEID